MTPEDARVKLAAIGFWFLRTPPTSDHKFWVEMACREFQRYARMGFAAMDPNPAGPDDDYPYRLTQVENVSPLPATVLVDGDVEKKETSDCIDAWHQSDWRIPVVISAWNTTAQGVPTTIKRGNANVWRFDEMTIAKRVRLLATDLSEVYEPWDPVARFRIVGTYTTYAGKAGGPWASAGQHTFAGIDYLNLTGDTTGAAATQQTFRVIAGVANAEAEMFFDAMNAYDDSVLSVGFYQWTVGRILLNDKQVKVLNSGELGGYMALLKYLKEAHHDPSFDLLMGRWDLDVNYEWDTIDDKGGLFNRSSKIYTTHLKEWRKTDTGHESVAITEARRAEFLKSWHWFYRFQAASRFSSHFEWSMWHMARVRLRDILATPWPEKAAAGDQIPLCREKDGSTRRATIGEVYRSEVSLALILRWHVWAPGEVIVDGEAGRGIRRAFNRACRQPGKKHGIDSSVLVDDWPMLWEEPLILGLREQIPLDVSTPPKDPNNKPKLRDRSKFIKSIARVLAVKTELDPPILQSTRTFAFDETNLPPAPKPAA